MTTWPRYPTIYEINTPDWLFDLGENRKSQIVKLRSEIWDSEQSEDPDRYQPEAHCLAPDGAAQLPCHFRTVQFRVHSHLTSLHWAHISASIHCRKEFHGGKEKLHYRG
jgi:hypothetical protein